MRNSRTEEEIALRGFRIAQIGARIAVIWIIAVVAFVVFPPARAIASSIVQSAYNLVQNEGTPLTRLRTINCVGLGITCSNVAGVTEFNVPAASATQQHTITFVIDNGGSAITTGALNLFPTAAFACTITRTDISADQTGSITVDIWKAAGAIPTGANKISASAPVTLSMSQLNQGGSIAGWSTAVSSGDVFGATVATAGTVTRVMVQIWCQ